MTWRSEPNLMPLHFQQGAGRKLKRHCVQMRHPTSRIRVLQIGTMGNFLNARSTNG